MSDINLIRDIAQARALLASSASSAIAAMATLENARTNQLALLTGQPDSGIGDRDRGIPYDGNMDSIAKVRQTKEALLASIDRVLRNPEEFGLE